MHVMSLMFSILLLLVLLLLFVLSVFFINNTSIIQFYTLSLHDALPILVLILLLMPTLNFLPVWFALSLLRFRLPSRLPMMFILWMVAMMVVIIPSRTV